MFRSVWSRARLVTASFVMAVFMSAGLANAAPHLLSAQPQPQADANISFTAGQAAIWGPAVILDENGDPPVLSLAPASGALPAATSGSACSQTFTASGGTTPSRAAEACMTELHGLAAAIDQATSDSPLAN